MKIGKRSKWISLFVIAAVLMYMLLMQAGIASAATLQPIINPAGGTFTTDQTVTISNIANGDTAYYTIDGTNPESSNTRVAYTGAFTMNQSETVQAASYDSTTGWSAVTSAVFYLNGTGSLEAPVINPAGGTFTTDQTVTISNIANGDTAYYTIDGTNPESSNTRVAYTGAFTMNQSETVQAASYDSTTGWSAVTSAVFYLNGSTIQTTGNNSAQIAQLEQELDTALSSGQMTQVTQILQQIQQLEAQNTNGTQLSTLEQQLTTAMNSNRRGKWARVAAIMKQIAPIEASESSTVTNNWVYPLLGQAYQQQGNNNINVFNNGNQINFDVQPTIINGRTMIPIRQVANAFGLSDNDINWNPNGTVTINNGSSQIQFSNNGQQAHLNGASYGLDVPAQIIDGRMMVPLRAIGQMFHRNVQWYPNGRIVTIQ